RREPLRTLREVLPPAHGIPRRGPRLRPHRDRLQQLVPQVPQADRAGEGREMTILVTGGAGFIGSNFVLDWIAGGGEDAVVNLDALTYAGNLANLASLASNPKHAFVRGDIAD